MAQFHGLMSKWLSEKQTKVEQTKTGNGAGQGQGTFLEGVSADLRG